MSRAVIAEYDANENTLRLVEPLKGVSDRAKVRVSIETDEALDPLAKLASLNAPTADIEQMLAEIAAGRR
ncbi:MAG: hypothetical protein QOC81_2619 [Thermoanaerobaculia bacterium]|jgi:hypothetical protein|nr:hypothetical protein [Thermoanaerobaculia bacterium]